MNWSRTVLPTAQRVRRRTFHLVMFGCTVLLTANGADAQGFKILGNGIDIEGLPGTVTLESSVGKNSENYTNRTSFRVKVGVLITGDGTMTCMINGAPTPIGAVFVWGKSNAGSFTCDPQRSLSAERRAEFTASVKFTTKTSVAGNVITLSANATIESMGTENDPLKSADTNIRTVIRHTEQQTVRLRVDGDRCSVLAFTGQSKRIEERIISGISNRLIWTRSSSNGPSTTCRLVD